MTGHRRDAALCESWERVLDAPARQRLRERRGALLRGSAPVPSIVNILQCLGQICRETRCRVAAGAIAEGETGRVDHVQYYLGAAGGQEVDELIEILGELWVQIHRGGPRRVGEDDVEDLVPLVPERVLLVHATPQLEYLILSDAVRRRVRAAFAGYRPNMLAHLVVGLERLIANLAVGRHPVGSQDVLFDVADLGEQDAAAVPVASGIPFVERAGEDDPRSVLSPLPSLPGRLAVAV